MAINYSIAMRSNPSDPEQPKRAYATAQMNDTLNIEQFAKHIVSHGCVYGKGDIIAILTIAIACIREQLLAGNIVQLGDFGKFSISLRSYGAKDAASFNAGVNMKAVKVLWTPGADLKTLLGDATFNRVLSKKEQAAAKKRVYEDGETLVKNEDKKEEQDNA